MPNFQMNTSEILYKTESSFEIENEWKVTDVFCLLLIYLKHSTEQKGYFIKL